MTLEKIDLLPLQDEPAAQVIDFIQSLDWVPAEIAASLTPETNIIRDLRLDSIAVMEFIMEFEIRFDTIIPLDTIAEIATISDLARVITPKTATITH
jgi:acyl carrier protein